MKLLQIVFFLFPLTNLFCQNKTINKEAAIDSIVNHYANEYSIVGLSIGIVNNGDSYTKHYGTTDLSKQHEVNDSTQFYLASISKLFTATAIFQLIENGNLSVETKLIDILPQFRMKDSRYKEIQIKHLLTHSSGLKWDNKLISSPDDSTSIGLFLEKLQQEKLKFTPGERMAYDTYSNIGFDLLGIVVEQVSGQAFDEYITQHILNPLGMTNSTYYFEEIDSARLAIPQIVTGDSKQIWKLNFRGIDRDKNPIVNGSPLKLKSYTKYGEEYEHNPSGNLISSTKEMNYWMQHLLQIYSDSTFNGILSQSTLKDMWNKKIATPNSEVGIAWGWWTSIDDQNRSFVFHTGNNPGFSTILILYPTENYGITILCNGWYAQEAVWHHLTKVIGDLYFKE